MLVSDNYLLTEFAFYTVKYFKDQGLIVVRTELLAKSVLKDRGLNILLYKKETRLVNGLLDDRANIYRKSTKNSLQSIKNFPKICRRSTSIFQESEFGLKTFFQCFFFLLS